jgi:hypothetical protein
VHRTSTAEDIFCDAQRLLHKYELPLNELLCLVTDGAPAVSGCKNGVVGKLTVKGGRTILNFQCIIKQKVLKMNVILNRVVEISSYIRDPTRTASWVHENALLSM